MLLFHRRLDQCLRKPNCINVPQKELLSHGYGTPGGNDGGDVKPYEDILRIEEFIESNLKEEEQPIKQEAV